MNIQNYINGEFHNPASNKWIDNYNPSNGEVYGQIPNSCKDDVENAYIAAKSAFPSWSQTTLEERSRILIKISELLSALAKRSMLASSNSEILISIRLRSSKVVSDQLGNADLADI